MKHLAGLAAGVLGLTLTGCPAEQTPTTSLKPTTRLLITEVATTFPVRINEFLRTEVRTFNPDDVSVGYAFYRGLVFTDIVFTAYFYPNRHPDDSIQSVKSELEEVSRMVLEKHPDAQVVGDESAATHQVLGTVRSFTFRQNFGGDAGESDARSDAYVFLKGRWCVKYRVTYRAERADDAKGRLKAFMSDLPWPDLR